MITTLAITSSGRDQCIDVTDQVTRVVTQSRVKEGMCWVMVPHTTAGVTINEGADSSVRQDILGHLDRSVPRNGPYHHREGNSAAHIKSSLVGCSQVIAIQDGRLLLGTWQSIYFCEFDGPRRRNLVVRIDA